MFDTLHKASLFAARIDLAFHNYSRDTSSISNNQQVVGVLTDNSPVLPFYVQRDDIGTAARLSPNDTKLSLS